MLHHFLTDQQYQEYLTIIEQDQTTTDLIKTTPQLKEVVLAGVWLSDELKKLNCHPSLLFRIHYTAGQLSYGKDPWQVHQDILEKYKNNQLQWDPEVDLNKN